MALISTKLFARYQRVEKALVLALMEMYVVGVSTRKVARVTEELCGTSFSKSTVSALCGRLDAELEAWRIPRAPYAATQDTKATISDLLLAGGGPEPRVACAALGGMESCAPLGSRLIHFERPILRG